MKHSPLHDLAGVLELLEGIFVPDAEETWVEDDEFVVFATTFDSKSGLLGLEIKATERFKRLCKAIERAVALVATFERVTLSEATEPTGQPLAEAPQGSATPQAQPDTEAAEHIVCRRPQGSEVQRWTVPASAQVVSFRLLPFPLLEGASAPSEPLVFTIETLSQARARGAVESEGAP